MPKFLYILILLFVSTAFAIVDTNSEDKLFHPPAIHDGMILSIEDCVSLAFLNSPKIKRKKYELDIAKSDVRIAQSRYFPVISSGVGFDYIRNSNDVYYDKKYRDLPNVAIAVNKMVWDFGKTSSLIKMQQFYKNAAEYEYMDELCHTLFDIKSKYYNLLKFVSLKDIANENIKLNQRFSNIATADIDKTTAKVYLNSANAKLINAEGEINTARFNLANSMYLDKTVNFSIKNTPTFLKNIYAAPFVPINLPFERKNAVDIAYKNSPDLEILTNTKKAMEQSLKYIKRSPMPELSAGVGYGYNHTNFASNNSLQVGVNLSGSTNLMELKYTIDSAKSQLDIADNEIGLFKKDLYYEVMRALDNIDTYSKQIPQFEKEIKHSTETLNLAFKKYEKNNLDYTALHDAIEDYILAKEKYILCLYNYNMSLIQAEMAMHYHMVDIHHKAEHAIHHHANELIEHLNEALNCNKKEKNKTRNKKRKNK